MSSTPNRNCFGLIIETDKYAGNFEREFCAYVTGRIGECGVGDELIDPKTDYSMFEESVISMPDDHGCNRPVTLCGYDAQSVMIYFENCPTDEQIAFIKEKAKTFNEYMKEHGNMGDYHKDVTVLGYAIEEFKFTSTKRKI